MKTFRSRYLLLAMGLVATTLSGTANTAPRLQTGPDAEITFDGLHRVDKTVVDAAWVKPDLDLRGYNQLMLVSAGISYRAVDNEGKRYVPGRSNDSEFYISPEARERLQQEMRDAFLEELADLERYEIVTEAGPGVLMLVGAVIDVVSSVPPVDSCVGRCDVYLSEVAQATLVLELRDSISGEILLRTVDRRAAESAGWPINVSAVTVWPEIRRLARTWGNRVRKGLDELESIDDLSDR